MLVYLADLSLKPEGYRVDFLIPSFCPIPQDWIFEMLSLQNNYTINNKRSGLLLSSWARPLRSGERFLIGGVGGRAHGWC